MSFALTTEQVQMRTKFVTRRLGWGFLKPGDKVRAVKKAMGLKKGEKIEPLAVIRIISNKPEPLNEITGSDCQLEGFPKFSPKDFVDMLVKHYKIKPETVFNRIQFEYVEEKYCEIAVKRLRQEVLL